MQFKDIIDMTQKYQEKQSAKRKEAIAKKIAVLRKQDPKKYQKLSAADFEEKKYVVKKNNPYSHGYIKHSITMLSLTESDMTFATTAELQKGKIYRLNLPVPMGITLVDYDKGGTAPEKGQVIYRGLLHSVAELDKRKIRQFVNDIFLTGVTQDKAKELEAFNAVQKAALEAKKLKASQPATPPPADGKGEVKK